MLACYGCKGFFRRTLTGELTAPPSAPQTRLTRSLSGKYRYACRFGNNCIVDKYQRNSCRYCRFQRCLEVGMDPKGEKECYRLENVVFF